jgi:hypothetical protein
MDALNIFSAGESNLGNSVSRDFYIGMFAYLITQGRGIAERNVEEFRRVVGFSTAKSKSAIGRRRKQAYQRRRIFTPSHPGRAVTPNARRTAFEVRPCVDLTT